MKTAVLIATIFLATIACWSQRVMQPIAPPQRPSLPINRPIIVNGDLILPDSAVPTNEPANAETNPPEMGATNPAEMESTNNMAEANTNNPALAGALDLTNRLSVMAPAQVQNVIQVQTELNGLQDVAGSLNGLQNIHRTAEENPEIRRHVQLLGEQIVGLARGSVKPSNDSVERLSIDLLRACSRAHLPQDHQLVLAVVLNLTLNSQNLPQTQLNAAINNGLVVLRTDGVPQPLCNLIGCDMDSLALEVQADQGS
jgi:hypothetical protein